MYKPPTDPLYPRQWNITKQNVDSAWRRTQGADVTVGIIDTGIDPTHKDLGGQGGMALVAGDSRATRRQKTSDAFNLIAEGKHPKIAGGWNFLDNSPDFFDDNRHGTAMAGIIAAESDGFGMVGIAPQCMIRAYKVLNNWGFGTQENTAKAVQMAAADGCDIISMSLAWRSVPEECLRKAVDKAVSSGVILVAAAGNHNKEGIETPASLEGTIAVGGCNRAGARWVHNKYRGSNWGTGLVCIAPASAMYTTRRMRSRFSQIDATSAATANVAGVIALLKSLNNTLTHHDIVELIKGTAQQRWRPETGWGILDAASLLKACPAAAPVPTVADRLQAVIAQLQNIARDVQGG